MRTRRTRLLKASWMGLLAFALALSVPGAYSEESSEDSGALRKLRGMSIEELMNVELTSVSKKREKRSEAAAAAYVITREDIRRSGATSIAEALRMAPGVHVAQISANKWAITVRGFNGLYTNKLLVLIDGRSVYSPLFSGVHWDQQDVLLEDVERIEVIRGPGAALWGANAVNGVINVITKSAKDTLGGLLSAGGGTHEGGFGKLRYGAKHGENTYWRVYTKYFDRNGYGVHDAWQAARAGFRIDWDGQDDDRLTLQGGLYHGHTGQVLAVPLQFPPIMRVYRADPEMAGGHLLGRWTRTYSDDADMALQVYYDDTWREDAAVEERRHTADVDFQHRLRLSPHHELLWGLGYRYTTDDTQGSFAFLMDPESRTEHIFSVFVQDTITLVEDRLRLTLGSKVEHNGYSGLEVQPSARLLWTPCEEYNMWAAVSRAVQTPSRAFHDMQTSFVRLPGAIMRLEGNEDSGSEELLAYELGGHVRPAPRLLLGLSAFYNVYDGLRTREPKFPYPELVPLPPHLVIPFVVDNRMTAEVRGVELTADWQATERWRLATSYSYLEMKLALDSSSWDTGSKGKEDQSPHHQASLRSYLDLPHKLEFDAGVYFVDELSGLDIPSYLRFDARLGWRPREDFEASLCVQNLFNDRHREFIPIEGIREAKIGRSIYGELTWRF